MTSKIELYELLRGLDNHRIRKARKLFKRARRRLRQLGIRRPQSESANAGTPSPAMTTAIVLRDPKVDLTHVAPTNQVAFKQIAKVVKATGMREVSLMQSEELMGFVQTLAGLRQVLELVLEYRVTRVIRRKRWDNSIEMIMGSTGPDIHALLVHFRNGRTIEELEFAYEFQARLELSIEEVLKIVQLLGQDFDAVCGFLEQLEPFLYNKPAGQRDRYLWGQLQVLITLYDGDVDVWAAERERKAIGNAAAQYRRQLDPDRHQEGLLRRRQLIDFSLPHLDRDLQRFVDSDQDRWEGERRG